MAKKVERWYQPGEALGGYHVSQSATERRRKALRSRHGDTLSTARALGATANVNKRKNPSASKAMKADSNYFYREYHKKKKK